MTSDLDVLAFVQKFAAEHGFPPTIREITVGVGLLAPSAALHHLKRLEKQGLITRGKNTARAIRVVTQ